MSNRAGCREVLSEETTCEDSLRNFMPGRQCALDKCEVSISSCQHLAWHPKTSFPTTPSPIPSHLLPPSLHSSPRLGLRPTDPNLPVLSLRTGPGQAIRGPGLPRYKKLSWGIVGWRVHLCPCKPLPPSVDRPAASLWKAQSTLKTPPSGRYGAGWCGQGSQFCQGEG